MAKRNHLMAPLRNEKGQISIFFSASLIVLISIIAFVINIGLFVKAKINLQNATDAAAFSGAAVQARQLTKIAYLNWEMRNIYKEWMYKYYVIGNLNVDAVSNPAALAGDVMKFNLQQDRNVLSGQITEDPYNIPAVCIHIAGSKTNICKRYAIPGLPEFGSSNLPGAEEASRAFMDTLISTKVNDCIDRTRLNMLVANTWTYNVMADNYLDQSLAGRGPAILADRQGAWPQAVELGLRIRNLEFIMNRPPETQGICDSGEDDVTNCRRSINSVIQENKLGNERIVKAFYSGYRNLGNAVDSEMKDSFTLTEIPPKSQPFTKAADASYLLVPGDKQQNYPKHWVDLKLMMVNYAIFYAAMIPRAESDTSGACDVTKVAIPVPGYPMGFYKNPDLITYYAVRGEAKFIGMFNPFGGNPVKMTAYSAAKPFGGRIGPMLFVQRENTDWFVGRTDNQKFRSVPYLSTFDFVGTKKRNGGTLAKGEFEPGVPLPINATNPSDSFWLDDPSKPVGGLVADTSGVQFGLPNLVYDYETPYMPDGYTVANTRIHTIVSKDSASNLGIGLYSKYQLNLFRGTALNDTVSPQALDQEIARVRAPTVYEAANYLIPTPHDFNDKEELDSFGFISGVGKDLTNGIVRYEADIYAPLHGDGSDQTDLLFENTGAITSTIFEFMRAQESGMKKYKMALNQAARSIYAQKDRVAGGAVNSAPGYIRAANGVSDIDFANPSNDQTPGSCASIAGQFLAFYYSGIMDSMAPNDAGCPVPLGNLIREYFASSTQSASFQPLRYRMSFSWPKNFSGALGRKMLTGYAPGPFTGVGPDGTFTNPIPGSEIQEVMRRNFYSTKFVALDSLQGGPGFSEESSGFITYSEGNTVLPPPDSDRTQRKFKNTLDANAIGADINSIKY